MNLSSTNNITYSINNPKIYGLVAGLLVSLLLLVIQFINMQSVSSTIFTKYSVLAVLLITGLNALKLNTSQIFKEGVKYTFEFSLLASAIISIINLMLYFTFPELGFNKFGYHANSNIGAFLISAMQFFEILVGINLIGFIALQFMKRRIRR